MFISTPLFTATLLDSERLRKLQLLQSMDLQWFADPEDEGRTEDPTAHKIKKAKEEGKFAKSVDLVSSIHLLFCSVAFGLLAMFLMNQLGEAMLYYFGDIQTLMTISLRSHVVTIMWQLLEIILPFLGIAFIAGAVGNIVQVGFVYSTKPIEFDLKKIVPNFGKFFKKGFFSGEALFNIGKSFLKVIALGIIVYLNIKSNLEFFYALPSMSIWDAFTFLFSLLITLLIEASILFLVFSIPDYIIQKKNYIKELRMTKYEVKREYKELEGDPYLKNILQQRMQEILSTNLVKSVDEATVVITNPTHYAIVLKYDKFMGDAPIVTGKGEDNLALKIRRLAKDKSIPIVENKPLARAIYDEVKVGDQIPAQFYNAIANILKEIYRIDDSMEVAI